MERSTPTLSTALINPFWDFWILGGASILVWITLVLTEQFRHLDAIETHFIQLGAVFSLLSLFCNDPHFIISYRFGYGRGKAFILKHWFCLIAVPVSLLVLFGFAYFCFDQPAREFPGIDAPNLGTEYLSIAIWLMYITVGWHYSKQIYGCMMVYAAYDKYHLSKFQKNLIKLSVFSIAVYNFAYFSIYAPEYAQGQTERPSFFGVTFRHLYLPKLIIPLSRATAILSVISVVTFVFYFKYRKNRQRPSPNFLIPWIAFIIWWLPVVRQMEFYFGIVPFFHSLQYLPFAYRLERSSRQKKAPNYAKTTFRVAGLLLIGFFAFELIPSLLDRNVNTAWKFQTSFFMIAFLVFINIHHFFIDSVVWKFNQPEIKSGLLTEL